MLHKSLLSIWMCCLMNGGKEFYMEGRRRSDLVRFEKFAGNKYIWDFKGGVSKGTSVDKHFNVYPIPSKDTSNNPNMHQNPKYE